MNDQAIQNLKQRIDDRIRSADRKRNRLGKNLNFSKFARILFGVSSISFVSLSAFAEFPDNLKFAFTLLALASTTIATFSDELIATFGFNDRYAQNVRVLGDLQNLKAELDLELILLSENQTNNDLDYWKYHNALLEILGSSHAAWQSNLNKGKA
ncbi:hypothetical protein AAFO92_01950 [Roseovarius sp. CAU 1744]|uniref:hypothetical protein n=1 Tax=Roseovarius sp. CAU 1744 TaxID=3140368 RepID=UPI00325B139E